MSRALPVLFGIALVGVALAVAVALSAVGTIAVAAWVLLLGLGALLVARRPKALPEGRTCTCCTSTVHDPVEVR